MSSFSIYYLFFYYLKCYKVIKLGNYRPNCNNKGYKEIQTT